MTPASAIAFASWLQTQHPSVFKAVVRASKKKPGLSDGDLDFDFDADTTDLDFSDGISADSNAFDLSDAISGETTAIDTNPIMAESDVGGLNAFQPNSVNVPTIAPASGGVSSLLSSIGNFLNTPQGINTVISATNQIALANSQAAVIQAQAQRAAAGQLPANVSYTSTGQPVLNTSSGQIPLNSSQIQALAPQSLLQSPFLWIILGAAALLYLTSGDSL